MRAQRLRRLSYHLLWWPPLKAVLQRLPLMRRAYNGWVRRHPYDVEHGVDTSGSVSPADCAPAAVASLISPYGGSQPSIVRAAIAALPDHAAYAFVDVGCGKGRALMVASEFPFARLIGVEISDALADIARRNAAVVAQRDPRRTAIEIQVGDATAVHLAAERIVYFMYHPFGRVLTERLVDNLERQLGSGLRHAFVVYYNPVFGDVLDRSPRFARWQADTMSYGDDELGFGPDLCDTVVTWQTVPARYPARPRASRSIVLEGLHASLDDSA